MPSRFLRELPPDLVDERRTSFGGTTTGGWGQQRSWSGGRDSGASSRGKPVAAYRAVAPPRDQDGVFAAASGAESESQDLPRFVKGERVRHRRFGSGAILGLTGVGKDLKVSVAFDDAEVGTKQLLVAFAGLEREWESA
jgi:DNA helicase-2/ATP-dependent DNA helicase PcrA